MRRFRRCLVAVALLGAGVAVVGAAPAATAYCEAEPTLDGSDLLIVGTVSSGGCTNSCTQLGTVINKVTKPGTWMCPQ